MFDALREVAGPGFRDDDEARTQALPGWHPAVAHGLGVPPGCVVAPASTEGLVEIASICRANGWRWGAVGGRTSTRAVRPVDVAIDMTGVRVLEVDSVGMRARVGAGWSLDALEEALLEQGIIHGHRLGSGKLATVGGAVATDACGAFHGRYGSVRDAVRAATWVASDGEVVACDASDSIFPRIGGPSPAEDAILIEAELRVHPEPEARAWAVIEFVDGDDAVEALRLVQRCDAAPALAGIFGDNQLVMAFEGDEIVQEACYRLGVAVAIRSGGRIIGGTEEGERWWETRTRTDLWSANGHPGLWADRAEAQVPWGRVKAVREAMAAVGSNSMESSEFELIHPSRCGVRLARSFTLRTDAEGWVRTLRDIRIAARSAGGEPIGP